MKDSLGVIIILLCLGGFAYWQIRDSAKKDARLQSQAEEIRRLRRQARDIDTAIGQWRRDYEQIAGERQEKRDSTREAARRDPTLKDQLGILLHPALLPGGGLLGRPGAHTRGPARADPAP